MSLGMNRRYERWKKLSNTLNSIPFSYKGFPLSKRDARTWSESLTLLGLLCEDLDLDSSVESGETPAYLFSIAKCDVREVCVVLKEADKVLLKDTESTHDTPLEEIKRLLIGITELASSILAPIWSVWKDWQDRNEVSDFARIHQYLTFLGKVSLRDIPEEDLSRQFIDIDESLPAADPTICRQLNYIIRDWLADFRLTCGPHFSSGATADAGKLLGGFTSPDTVNGKSSLLSKYLHLCDDKNITRVVERYAPDFSGFLNYPKLEYSTSKRRLLRESVLQYVPKSALTKRIIAEEPVTLNFWQKAIQVSLYDYFDSHKELSQHIAIRNQAVNAELALAGSSSGMLATLDLSHASDSVSWDLVKRVFKGTGLLSMLWVTRCTKTWTAYGLVTLKKFATMGSAVTFPVETLIFCAICEYARRVKCKQYKAYYPFIYHVYGDDIVCDHELVPLIVDTLTTLGFQINKEKSFSAAGGFCFRESCGLEAYGGNIVTPLRLSRNFVAEDLLHHPDSIGTILEMANMAYLRGLKRVRQYLISTYLLALPQSLRPKFKTFDQSLSVQSLQEVKTTNAIWTTDAFCDYNVRHARPPHQRFLPDYHRCEIWIGVCRRRQSWKGLNPIFLEQFRYYHYWVMKCKDPMSNSQGLAYIGPLRDLRLESCRVPFNDYYQSSFKGIDQKTLYDDFEDSYGLSRPSVIKIRTAILTGTHILRRALVGRS